MQTGISKIFDSYNLYAKAFPGITFLLGLISVFPKESSEPGLQLSPILVAIFALLIIILGFVIGQGLHSVAVVIENTIYKIAKSYYVMNLAARILLSTHTRYSMETKDGRDLSRRDIPIILSLPIGAIILWLFTQNIWFVIGYALLFLASLFSTIKNTKNWVSGIYMPHRSIFKKKMDGNTKPVNKFRCRIQCRYDWVDDDDLDSIYSSAISYLSFIQSGRAYHFQSIFAFCRSMWAILLFYSFLYLSLLIEPSPPSWLPHYLKANIIQLSQYDPLIAQYISGDIGLIFLGGTCLVLGLIFMEAERQYKRWFVEYLIIDYLVTDADEILSQNA